MMKLLLLAVLIGALHAHPLTNSDLSNDIPTYLRSSTLPHFPASSTTPHFKLHMKDQPRFIKTRIGARIVLNCEAVGSPPPKLQWFIGQRPISEALDTDDDYETNTINNDAPFANVKSRFVIDYPLPVHDGVYTCVAKSGAQIETTATRLLVDKSHDLRNWTDILVNHVLVHHVPVVTLWMDNMVAAMGSDVVLPCRALGNPKPQVEWSFVNGGEGVEYAIEENMAARVSVLPDGDLSIKALRWADMGEFKCKATNMKGEDKVKTFVYPTSDVNL